MGGWLEKWRIKQSSNLKFRLKLKLELGNNTLLHENKIRRLIKPRIGEEKSTNTPRSSS